MAELPYPYYRLNCQGPNETGFSIVVQIQEGAGGPLPGQTQDSVIAALREQLMAGDVEVLTDLTRVSITNTYS